MQIGVTAYRPAGNNSLGKVAVVLVHAFPIDGRMWDRMAEKLNAQLDQDAELSGLPVYGFSMPGTPGVPVPSEEESGPRTEDGAYAQALDRLSQAMIDKLHELGYEKAIWVGLSMGGYVVLRVHSLAPQAVAGLALCDSTPAADSPQARAGRLSIAHNAEGEMGAEAVMKFARPSEHDSAVKKSADFIDTFTQWIHEQPVEGLAWRERMAAGRPDQFDSWDSLRVPTLVVSGELDPSSSPAVMKPFAERVHGALFVEIPDTGHFTAFEQPEQFATVLMSLFIMVLAAAE